MADIVSGVNTDNQNLTGATLNGSNVLQIDIEDGSSATVDLSSLEESAAIAANTTAINTNTTNIATNTSDISTNAGNISTNATNIATNTTDISTNAGNISTNATNIAANTTAINTNTTNIATNTADIATNASGISTNATDIANHVAADGDLSSSNELITGFAVNGSDLEITEAGTVFQVPLADIVSGVNTDNQNLTGATLNGSNVLQIDIEDGSSATVDLSSLEESAAIAANTTAINTNTTNIATNTSDISTNAGNISTNSTNIATNTTNIATNTSDISTNAGNVSTNATNIATNTSDIATNASGISTNATDIANHVTADGDLSSSNELITGFAVNGSDLEITEAGTVFQVPLADIVSGVNSDDQNLTGASLNGSNVLQIDIEDGSSATVDLSSLANNLYSSDGTLTGTRTVNLNSNDLDFDGNLFLDASTSSIGVGNYSNNVTESTFHGASNQTTDGSVEAGWIYAQAIEAVNEKGSASTAIIVGQDDNFNSGGDEITLVTDGNAQLRVSPQGETAGTVRLEQYGSSSITGTPTTMLAVEADGDVVEVNNYNSSRIFYPPSIEIDASTNGSFTVDLYAQYVAQFGSPTVASSGAPAAVPTYTATDLYYYVTYADPTVFNTGTMSIDANGVLSYEIIGQPSDYNSLINVVFVVK